MLNNQAQVAAAVNHMVPVVVVPSTVTGSAWVDVRNMVGDVMFIQTLGAVVAASSLAGKIQDATDAAGTGVADITGAAFAASTVSGNVQKLTVAANATRGFVRYTGTVSGGTSALFGVCLLSVLKTV